MCQPATAVKIGDVLITNTYDSIDKNFNAWATTTNEKDFPILAWLTQVPTLMQNHSGGDSVASRC